MTPSYDADGALPPLPPPVFSFVDTGVRRGDRWVLRDVTADVPGRGITAVSGPSGSGKTTLLRLCNRLEVPSAGRVCFSGADVASLDPLRLRRNVGLVSQRPVLFGGTVRDNMRVALPDADDQVYADALRRTSLGPDFLDRPGTELSGGEAQRVCLARTLVTGPQVLLLDEPTSSLDDDAKLAFERLGRQLADDGTPILWVTHDLAQRRRIGDHVIDLADGRLKHSGPLPDD